MRSDNRRFQIFGRSWMDAKGNHRIGRKTIITTVVGEEEARRMCGQFNDNRDARQIRTWYKWEYTSQF